MNKSRRFSRCNKEFIVFKCEGDDCDHKKIKAFNCEVRICPECSRKNALNLYFELKDMIKDQIVLSPGCRFRHVVLTVPVSSLKQDVEKAYRRIEYIRQYCHKKFRDFKHKWGAVIGFELGRKNLMAHFHILLYCPWIDQKEIQKVWKWGHVYISLVNAKKDRNKALYNVCLYVVQFFEKFSGELPDPRQVASIEHALKRRRRVKTWGIFYNRVAMKWKAPMICKKCGGQMYLADFIDENGQDFPFEYWFLRYIPVDKIKASPG